MGDLIDNARMVPQIHPGEAAYQPAAAIEVYKK
jgi:hypothetical protein